VSEGRDAIGQLRAAVLAVGIVLYFTGTTIWLPSALLRSPILTGASRNVSDFAALAVWGLGLWIGIWALRRAQARGWI
jgi:hypothetical protein